MATIFDNVEIQPPKQGPPGYLTLAMLVANCWLEAEKAKEERLALQRGDDSADDDAPTLEAIMERAGLNIPGISEAVTQMMGGGDEVQQAMGLIHGARDPAKILQGLVGQIVQQQLASLGLGTTTTKAPAKDPARSTASVVPLFRPEFTREARETAKAGPPEKQSPDAPAATPGPQSTAKAKPLEKKDLQAPAATPNATPQTSAPTSLVQRVERRIDALRQKTQQFQTMLEARLTAAEARLAALREELRRLTTTEAPVTNEAPVAAEVPSAQQELPFAPPAAPATEAETSPTTEAPLPAATEAELLRAVEVVEAFAEDLTEQQAANVARVEMVEHEVGILEEAVRAAQVAREKATRDG